MSAWRHDSALKDDGERIIPDALAADDSLSNQLYAQHLERYRRASARVRGLRALDIACGSGFGAASLAEAGAAAVVAADIDPRVVAYARQRYPHPGIDYRVGSIDDVEAGAFDLITCFETLEHVVDPPLFLAGLRRCLAPGGRLMISATVVETKDIYKFHLHDFSAEAFRALCVKAGFHIQAQFEQCFQASPREVRRSMKGRDTLPPLSQLASHPWRLLTRALAATVWSGLTYANLMLELGSDQDHDLD